MCKRFKMVAAYGGAVITTLCFFVFCISLDPIEAEEADTVSTVDLPTPSYSGEKSLEEVIYSRKSVRDFSTEPLTIKEISQLLWAAGGKTVDGVSGATRSFPSAGGIYPLEIYLFTGEIDSIPAGVYRYIWEQHRIDRIISGDKRQELMQESRGQYSALSAPAIFVITAHYEKTISRYGERGEERYVPIDMGACGQTIYLQAEALGLGTVILGSFTDEAVKKVLGVDDETPLCIMPVGKKR
jgi:SagB-type dehydrogenase family enzyme